MVSLLLYVIHLVWAVCSHSAEQAAHLSDKTHDAEEPRWYPVSAPSDPHPLEPGRALEKNNSFGIASQ
jgi:hypothetical protein